MTEMIARLMALLAFALGQWELEGTRFADMEVRWQLDGDGSLGGYGGDAGMPAAYAAPCEREGCKYQCFIGVTDVFWRLEPVLQETVMVHEVGHCIGFDHDSGHLMTNMLDDDFTPRTKPSPALLAQKRRLAPYRWQAWIPMWIGGAR